MQTGNLQTPDYDVAVIGSGPAACAAAICCRRSGLSVLMVTASPRALPTDLHAPSESLHPGIASLLRHLGADAAPDAASLGYYHGIETAAGLNGFTPHENGEWRGTHVSKAVFNSKLVSIVRGSGADICFDETVVELVQHEGAVIGIRTGSGKKIIAKYTIDASGRNSVAGKALGLEADFFSLPLVAWSGRVTGLPYDHPVFKNDLAKFNALPGGWEWLAPEANGACTFTCLSLKGRQAFAVPRELAHAGTHHPLIKCNMRWRLYKTPAMEGLLLCGDAAAVLDPAAGQGVLNALYSGIKAAETAGQCIHEPAREKKFLEQYAGWLSAEYIKKAQQLKDYYSEQNIFLS